MLAGQAVQKFGDNVRILPFPVLAGRYANAVHCIRCMHTYTQDSRLHYWLMTSQMRLCVRVFSGLLPTTTLL